MMSPYQFFSSDREKYKSKVIAILSSSEKLMIIEKTAIMSCSVIKREMRGSGGHFVKTVNSKTFS